MTKNQIEKRQQQQNVPYELAKQIRQLLDEARKQYGPTDWDGDDIEVKIAELVFDE